MMGFLYRFTISYFAFYKGERVTTFEYFYRVYSPRRLDADEIKRRREVLQRRTIRHLKRTAKNLKFEHERTGIEVPRRSREKRKVITGEALKFRVKGKAKMVKLRITKWERRRRARSR